MSGFRGLHRLFVLASNVTGLPNPTKGMSLKIRAIRTPDGVVAMVCTSKQISKMTGSKTNLGQWFRQFRMFLFSAKYFVLQITCLKQIGFLFCSELVQKRGVSYLPLGG